jgi:hypothetical protein
MIIMEIKGRRLLGNFGELTIAWWLNSKYNINTIMADTTGFDLLALDKDGRFFPKNRNVAISVKARERGTKKDKISGDNVFWHLEKLENSAKEWNAEPWFAHVRIVPELGFLETFLMPIEIAKKYSTGPSGKKKRMSFHPKKAENDKDIIKFKMSFESYKRITNE